MDYAAEINARVLDEMRGWLSDCEWADVDAEDIAAMPAERIIAAVRRHFDGGVVGFLLAVA